MTQSSVGPPRRFSLSVSGVLSPVLATGPDASSEAVVVVHGNPGAANEWSDLLAQVGPFTRAVAVDMPGFADADKPRDFEYTVDATPVIWAGCSTSSGSAVLIW